MATIFEALAIAIQHHQEGRLQTAERIYRQILAVVPNQADAWHLLGMIAYQMGKHAIAVEYIERAIGLNGAEAAFHNNLGEAYRALRRVPEAVACYRQALQRKPDYAEAHNNLGNALKEQKKLDHAVAHYRQALELKADYAEAYYNLGNALSEQGNLGDAIACYRRALELKPDFAETHNNLGNALDEQGKLDEAVVCYRRALDLKPDVAETHNNLGKALSDQGKLDEAIASFRRALELRPAYTKAFYNLGNAFREQGKLDEAIESYRRVLELNSDYAAANNPGKTLKQQGKLDEAITAYHRALQLQPDYAEAQNNLGRVLQEIGDLQGAEDAFRATLRHNSRFALAHYNLATLLGGKLPENDLDAQRRLLQEKQLTDAQRLLLHFGTAQVLDSRGEYAAAAEHLDRGNALQRSEQRKRGQKYDPQEYGSFVGQMIMVCTPDFFERVRGFGLDSEIPVFVVGLPRSGTTLVEQILASHSQVFGAGEIKLTNDTIAAFGNQDADIIEGLRRLDRPTALRLASRHLARLRELRCDALRIVDKLPENYLFLGLLASLFPRAKLIHCRRDLRDVAVSCWMTHFQEVRWANDQQHIASRFHEYERIMDHWRMVLPVPMLEVEYEETVADLEGVARKLVAWCGLAWEPSCLEFYQAKRPIRTASAVQVRQPVFRTSVARWKHYEPFLASLFAQLDRTTNRARNWNTDRLGKPGGDEVVRAADGG